MSDDDRLTSYVRQAQRHVRKLPDGCVCGASGLACRAQRYLNGADAACCDECSHAEA